MGQKRSGAFFRILVKIGFPVGVGVDIHQPRTCEKPLSVHDLRSLGDGGLFTEV